MSYSYRDRGIEPHGFDDQGSSWVCYPFGDKGHFMLKLEAESKAMTGQAATVYFRIPYPHRLVNFEAKHTTSAGVNDTTALAAATFKVDKSWKTVAAASKMFVLWDFSGVVASDFLHNFGECYERPPSHYEITVNTTEDHLMYYEVIFQLLDKKGREAPGR